MIEAVYAGRLVQVVDYDVALLTILYAAGGNPVLLGIVREDFNHRDPGGREVGPGQ